MDNTCCGLKALDEISLCFEPGIIYGLFGRGGARESTICNLIRGRILPGKGLIRLDGSNPVDDSPDVREMWTSSCTRPIRPCGVGNASAIGCASASGSGARRAAQGTYSRAYGSADVLRSGYGRCGTTKIRQVMRIGTESGPGVSVMGSGPVGYLTRVRDFCRRQVRPAWIQRCRRFRGRWFSWSGLFVMGVFGLIHPCVGFTGLLTDLPLLIVAFVCAPMAFRSPISNAVTRSTTT